jgi:thiol:disulfide interchange protein DsbC
MLRKTIAMTMLGLMSTFATADVTTVKANLAKHHPTWEFQNIQTTEMDGIYSAELDGQVVYLNQDAQHILAGSMFRLSDKVNLTRDLTMKMNAVDWKKLPFKDALKTVRGTGARQLAIFSDPNCPYCKQLEVELKKLDNVTIYTFVLAFKPQSVAPSKQVFCESNPTAAWENLIVKGIQPSSKKSCANPIDRNLALAKELKITGTPTIIFANGMRVPGGIPLEQIEDILKKVSAGK